MKIKLPPLQIQQQIIDIIEPLENVSLIINKMINEIKKLLVKKYNLCPNDFVSIEKLSNLKNQKWNNQKFYYDTSAINEFKINYEKRIDILHNKPSRADLSPVKNSFLLSKLLGENKIYFVTNDQENVFSTGFLNLTTKCIDHISGFFLSNEFKNQKIYLSTGTTMVGLNNTNFKKILVKTTHRSKWTF